ncbi:MAG: hypothetical protein JNL79_04590 [Myxococcales bacterium]|nr:hypothetical protein [Myxococcales bacterium]
MLLDQSYDGHAGPEARLFPEENGRTVHCADAEAVVDLLYRDGRVPEWVDLTVVGEDVATTIVEVRACGRFVEDDARLYYTWCPDQAPFGLEGPTLPVGWVQGQRFSIHHRSSCWSRADLENACRHGREVWSLELHGTAFDDVLSGRLPLPALEILELHGVSPVSFAGLAGLSRLRVLRLDLGGRALDLASLPRLPALSMLSLDGLPSRIEGVARLASSVPALRELTLSAKACAESDARLALPVRGLTLRMPTLPEWVAPSPSLRKLSLDASQITNADVCAWLAACPRELEDLSLRGALVSDEILADLRQFRALQFLTVIDTAVTLEALERFAKGRRNFRHLPRR